MNKQGRCLVLLAPDIAVDFTPFGRREPIFEKDEITRMREANGIRVIEKAKGKSHKDLVVEVLNGTVDKATIVVGLGNDNPDRYVYVKEVSIQLRKAIKSAFRGARNSKCREESLV